MKKHLNYTRADTAYISRAMWDELNERFPLTAPHPGKPIEEIMFEAGHRFVIDWLAGRIRGSAQDEHINRTVE